MVRRVVLSVLIAVAAVASAAPADGDVTEMSANAFGLLAVMNEQQVVAGPEPVETLPPDGGGPFTQTLTFFSVPQLDIEVGELSAAVEGSGVGTHDGESSANVIGESFALEDVVFADFDANCSADADGARGGTAFLGGDVIVNGSPQALPQNPAPGTVIDASPSARVILNEQSVANQPGSASITVTALHITVLDGSDETDILVGQVQCRASGPDVLPAAGAPAPSTEPPLPLTEPAPSTPLVVTPRFTG